MMKKSPPTTRAAEEISGEGRPSLQLQSPQDGGSVHTRDGEHRQSGQRAPAASTRPVLTPRESSAIAERKTLCIRGRPSPSVLT